MTTAGDRLFFFSGSADLPPGQGVHERLADAGRYAELAQGDGATARKHRQLALLDAATLSQWDTDKTAVMRSAMHAKFSSHEPLRAVLLATAPAQLWHGAGRGQAPAHIEELEAIRAEVRPQWLPPRH